MALDALSAILAYDDLTAGLPWVQMMEDCGGLDRLEQLQEHENRSVNRFLQNSLPVLLFRRILIGGIIFLRCFCKLLR